MQYLNNNNKSNILIESNSSGGFSSILESRLRGSNK